MLVELENLSPDLSLGPTNAAARSAFTDALLAHGGERPDRPPMPQDD